MSRDMAGMKPIEMAESDIEFFRRELKSKEPNILTLITGTGNEAQKVMIDMLDAGANIQDGKLSEKHQSAVDGNKMRIEQTIRIEESLIQGSAMPGMTLRNKRGQMKRQTDGRKPIDLTIADDMKQIDCPRELKRAIDTSDLKQAIDERFNEVDFSVKEFQTADYPKNSQAYLVETAFYCRKAREYRAKGQKAAAEAKSYRENAELYDRGPNIRDQYYVISDKYTEVGEGYSEVFYYCLQEAVYWKLRAEIYNYCEKDKIMIEDPTKTSSCKIHNENDVIKYLYVPTDKKNIDKANIDLELTKVGFGGRHGFDNVMLIVKEMEECKELNTLDMMETLSFYGGSFKDRGMVMVTEEKNLIDDAKNIFENEDKYYKNEARSDDYSNLVKTLTNEKRFFSFEKKRVDIKEPTRRTEWGEILKEQGEDRLSIGFKNPLKLSATRMKGNTTAI